MTQDYLIGTQLDEYRLESLLGRGGMARVYRGIDVNLSRPTAIKVIDLPHRAEEEYVERFQREAKAIAQLDHPHIVRLYRYGETPAGPAGDSMLYMAMQFIQGADLAYVLNSYRADGEFMEIQEVSRIIREVCSALDYAHANGIIHRDIKPSNIMLDLRGAAILTDFGLAMLSTEATRGEIFGSPHYISPEQVKSSAKAVPQSDLYSVGVILYEMLTGVLPFVADEPLELALMHVNCPVSSPRKLRPALSPELETVVLKALEKRPEERYPTGQALADAFDQALTGKCQAIADTRITLPQRVTLGFAKQDLPTLQLTQDIPEANPVQAPEVEPTITTLPGKKETLPVAPTASVQRQTPFSKVSGGQVPASTLLFARSWIKNLKRPTWIIGGIGSLLLLMLCLASYGLLNSGLFLPKSEADAMAPVGTSDPTAALIATVTPLWIPTRNLPTQTPEATSTVVGTHSFQITRRSERRRYLILQNNSDAEIPMNGMVLRVKKSQLLASVWGIEQLKPGECLLVKNEDDEGRSIPQDLGCDFVGKSILVKKSLEDLFSERLDVYIGEQKIGTCEQGAALCPFSFTD